MPKGSLLALLDEVGGPALSGRHASQKKSDISASCEKLFAGEVVIEEDVKAKALAWVPNAMRFAGTGSGEGEGEAEDDLADLIADAVGGPDDGDDGEGAPIDDGDVDGSGADDLGIDDESPQVFGDDDAISAWAEAAE